MYIDNEDLSRHQRPLFAVFTVLMIAGTILSSLFGEFLFYDHNSDESSISTFHVLYHLLSVAQIVAMSLLFFTSCKLTQNRASKIVAVISLLIFAILSAICFVIIIGSNEIYVYLSRFFNHSLLLNIITVVILMVFIYGIMRFKKINRFLFFLPSALFLLMFLAKVILSFFDVREYIFILEVFNHNFYLAGFLFAWAKHTTSQLVFE